MANSNGSKPITNPAINRMLEQERQQQQFLMAMYNSIPGAELTMTMEELTPATDQDGKSLNLVKQMYALPSGPVVVYMHPDFAEKIANSLLEKVQLARTGLEIASGPGPLYI